MVTQPKIRPRKNKYQRVNPKCHKTKHWKQDQSESRRSPKPIAVLTFTTPRRDARASRLRYAGGGSRRSWARAALCSGKREGRVSRWDGKGEAAEALRRSFRWKQSPKRSSRGQAAPGPRASGRSCRWPMRGGGASRGRHPAASPCPAASCPEGGGSPRR